MANGDQARERHEAGGIAIEWLAVGALLVSLLAAVASGAAGSRIADSFRYGACQVISGVGGDSDCERPGESPPDESPPDEPPPDAPEDPYDPEPEVDCDALPTRGERMECLMDRWDPYDYSRAYVFQVGDCAPLSVAYAQVPPGVESIGGDLPAPHDGAAHVELAPHAGDGVDCDAQVRFNGQAQGLGMMGDQGWSDWSEHGYRTHGQEILEIEVLVTQPDGTETLIRIGPDDGFDVGRNHDPDEFVIHQY